MKDDLCVLFDDELLITIHYSMVGWYTTPGCDVSILGYNIKAYDINLNLVFSVFLDEEQKMKICSGTFTPIIFTLNPVSSIYDCEERLFNIFKYAKDGFLRKLVDIRYSENNTNITKRFFNKNRVVFQKNQYINYYGDFVGDRESILTIKNKERFSQNDLYNRNNNYHIDFVNNTFYFYCDLPEHNVMLENNDLYKILSKDVHHVAILNRNTNRLEDIFKNVGLLSEDQIKNGVKFKPVAIIGKPNNKIK